MKSYSLIFVVLLVTVQIYLSQTKLTESLSESDDLKHTINKRIDGLWGKRLQDLWGKRSESDSDELYQRILRELYHNARSKQMANPRYSANNDLNPLTFEQLLAQRKTWSDDNEATA